MKERSRKRDNILELFENVADEAYHSKKKFEPILMRKLKQEGYNYNGYKAKMKSVGLHLTTVMHTSRTDWLIIDDKTQKTLFATGHLSRKNHHNNSSHASNKRKSQSDILLNEPLSKKQKITSDEIENNEIVNDENITSPMISQIPAETAVVIDHPSTETPLIVNHARTETISEEMPKTTTDQSSSALSNVTPEALCIKKETEVQSTENEIEYSDDFTLKNEFFNLDDPFNNKESFLQEFGLFIKEMPNNNNIDNHLSMETNSNLQLKSKTP